MAMTKTLGLTERDWQQLLDQQGRPCVCDDRGGVCLAHYGSMDNRDRARMRRAIGISDFEDRRY